MPWATLRIPSALLLPCVVALVWATYLVLRVTSAPECDHGLGWMFPPQKWCPCCASKCSAVGDTTLDLGRKEQPTRLLLDRIAELTAEVAFQPPADPLFLVFIPICKFRKIGSQISAVLILFRYRFKNALWFNQHDSLYFPKNRALQLSRVVLRSLKTAVCLKLCDESSAVFVCLSVLHCVKLAKKLILVESTTGINLTKKLADTANIHLLFFIP